MADVDEFAVALRVAAVLDELGIEYTLGGSLASSLHGEPRATNDIDFAVRLEERHVSSLVESLGADFVIDPDSFRDAVRRGGSYAIYFLPLVLKVAVFVRGAAPVDRSEFARRVRVRVGDRGSLYTATPEDSLLRKLVWFREGGEVSDRQWRDVLGILRISRSVLDCAYLDRWAEELAVADLLHRALRQGTGTD